MKLVTQRTEHMKARPLGDRMHFAGQMCITKNLAARNKATALLSLALLCMC